MIPATCAPNLSNCSCGWNVACLTASLLASSSACACAWLIAPNEPKRPILVPKIPSVCAPMAACCPPNPDLNCPKP